MTYLFGVVGVFCGVFLFVCLFVCLFVLAVPGLSYGAWDLVP